MRFIGKECIFAVVALLFATRLAVAGIDDFKLDSIEIVDLRSRTEIDWLGKQPRPMQALIMATFSGDLDLRAYSRRFGYNVFDEAGLCRDERLDPSKPLTGEYSLYDSFGQIDFSLSSPDSSSASDGSSTYLYHVYINVMFEWPEPIREEHGSTRFSYDLQAHPEDVCVRIRGGTMLGQSFASNTIVIPKEDIAEAVSQSSVLKTRK